MYHCGPTVYQRATIGNLRMYVFADTLRRMFEQAGYKVNQVINITDVGHLTDDASAGEDKMEREAQKVGRCATDIAQEFTDKFLEDIATLNVRTAGTRFPKATDHIAEQIILIKMLEARGFTYETKDGIYFDTSKFENYGTLGNIDIEGLKTVARVEHSEEKKNPTDFALWKKSPNTIDPHAPARQQEWPSPWGVGFPGWHIECSAMSIKYLGETFDVHTGGIDHIPVHHNNEIAQSEAATGQPFAHYWMHGNFITIDGQRIGKSIGNVLYLDTLEKNWDVSPLAYRYWLLTAHYSTQANVTENALKGAAAAYERLCALTSQWKKDAGWFKNFAWKKIAKKSAYGVRMIAAVRNDLDTPKAIATLWEMAKDSTITDSEKYSCARLAEELLGLPLTSAPISKQQENTVPADIEELAQKRDEARAKKDWKEADRLRDLISKKGYILKDSGGTSIVSKK